MSAGMYFNTGVQLSGGWIWKSIDKIVDEGEETTFYIFRAADGWYAADTLWITVQGRKEVATDGKILFWAAAEGDFEDAPMQPLHYP
eukprot:3243208-Pyramimonas_sp.AAC.1